MSKSSQENRSFRKSLKGPDAFQSKAAEGISVLEDHKNVIVGVLLALVILVVGGFGVNLYQDSKRQSVREAYAVFEDRYQEEAQQVVDKREKLNKEIEGYRKSIEDAKKSENESEKAKVTELEAKIKSAEGAMDSLKPDHSKSAEGFRKFFNENLSEPEGLMAGLRLVSIIQGDSSKLGESKKVLETILANSSGLTFYEIYGRLLYVGVLEDLKDYASALKQVEELLKKAPKEMLPKILLSKARIQIASADKDAGKATLDQLIKEHENAPEIDQARTFRSLIN